MSDDLVQPLYVPVILNPSQLESLMYGAKLTIKQGAVEVSIQVNYIAPAFDIC